jgi:hypothetical protein
MISGGYFNNRPVGGVYPLDFAAPRPVVPSLLRDDAVRSLALVVLTGVMGPRVGELGFAWQQIAILVDIICWVNFSSFDGEVNASDGICGKFARCHANEKRSLEWSEAMTMRGEARHDVHHGRFVWYRRVRT